MEKFSIKKLFDLSPMGFAKVFGLGWKIFVLVLLLLGVMWIKNLFFPPISANVNQPEIHVASGGSLNYSVSQTANKKRPWWLPSPFVELFTELKTNNDKPATGARFGGRWEF